MDKIKKMYCNPCGKKFACDLQFCEFCGTKNPFYGMRCKICNKEINVWNSRIGLRICHVCERNERLKTIKLGEEKGIKKSFGIKYRYTWRSTENFEGLKISKDIENILKIQILNKNQVLPKQIIEELIPLGICDKSGNLTNNGRIFAISLMPLDDQCDILNIPITKINLPPTKNPEIDALNYFKENGYSGSWTEGAIIWIIVYSICFDKLFPIHEKKFANDTMIYINENITSAISYSRHFMSFKEYFIDLEDELIKTIKSSNIVQVSKNYDIISSFQPDRTWPILNNVKSDISKDFLLELYSKLGNNTIADIIKLFFKDPQAYIIGWPDLIVIKNNDIKFIEVKTHDKLLRSQIITICDFMKNTSLDLSVLKIIS